MSYSVGDRVWLADEEHAWLAATVKATSPTEIQLQTAERGLLKLKAKDANLEACGNHLDENMDNLVDLDELSEGAILYHVKKRYKKREIYTHVGAILVAVNPFEPLDIYGPLEIKRAKEHTHAYPHVYVTAAVAYAQMRTHGKNQSVLISGESGAGKTETTKKVLSYLANVAPGAQQNAGAPGVEEKILQSNPLLEALGNAKTLRNNNSSRFGKWMKVDFCSQFRIQGCEIVNYLLEKSRVVFQSENERNYHIFYQLLVGADANLRSKLHLLRAEEYRYLDQSGCIEIPGHDDRKDFDEMVQAMETLQFSQDTILNIFKIIATVLALGNITFVQGSRGESESQISPDSMGLLAEAAKMLGVDLPVFTTAMTEKMVNMGRETVAMKYNVAQAEDSRDTLSKSLYSNLFDWVIAQVNTTLKTTSKAPFCIGVLDIFGFEVFEMNTFEQLCINYANEKLQFHFNEVIFNQEMKMYLDEGISLDAVHFEDNAECVGLIEGKPIGLISLLDEECSLGNATDASYISKIKGAFEAGKATANAFFTKHKTKPQFFSVRHFAGEVEYCVAGWLDKNKDTLSISLRNAMTSSSSPLIAELFTLPEEPSTTQQSSKKAATTRSTLGGQFRTQLIGLLANLRLTEPHFVRCVKPNHSKEGGGVYDGQLVLRQLRYAGLFEAIRIRKSGYAFRETHERFFNQYQILADNLALLRKKDRLSYYECCHRIINQVVDEGVLPPGESVAVVGTTRVFLKDNAHRACLERHKRDRVVIYAIKIQAAARVFLGKMKLYGIRYAAQKELARLQNLKNKRNHAAIICQKIVRGYLVKCMMAHMSDLIDLRRALKVRDLETVQIVLARIEASQKQQQQQTSNLTAMFRHEVTVARTMVKLIEIQNNFVKDMSAAIETKDVILLNRLLVRGERLEMSNHPIAKQARDELRELHRRRVVMKNMVAFLKNENEFNADPADLLKEADALGIDSEFITKVRRVYDNAGPRLRARIRLRTAIETVDKAGMLHCLTEVNALQKFHPKFSEAEVRAAELMLRLLDFENQLVPRKGTHSTSLSKFAQILEEDSSGVAEAKGDAEKERAEEEEDDGPRLTPEVLSLCDEICSNPDLNVARAAKRRLQLMTRSPSGLEEVVRCYKWSKMLCIWKYPEIRGGGGTEEETATSVSQSASHQGGTLPGESSGEEFEFFGLRAADARSSLFLIRMLHQDVSPMLGEAPPSVQAAMGALDVELPNGVREAMDKLDQQVSVDKNIRARLLQNNQSPAKMEVSAATMRRRQSMGATQEQLKAASNKLALTKSPIKAKPLCEYENISKDLEQKLVESRLAVEKKKKFYDKAFEKLKGVPGKKTGYSGGSWK